MTEARNSLKGHGAKMSLAERSQGVLDALNRLRSEINTGAALDPDSDAALGKLESAINKEAPAAKEKPEKPRGSLRKPQITVPSSTSSVPASPSNIRRSTELKDESAMEELKTLRRRCSLVEKERVEFEKEKSKLVKTIKACKREQLDQQTYAESLFAQQAKALDVLEAKCAEANKNMDKMKAREGKIQEDRVRAERLLRTKKRENDGLKKKVSDLEDEIAKLKDLPVRMRKKALPKSRTAPLELTREDSVKPASSHTEDAMPGNVGATEDNQPDSSRTLLPHSPGVPTTTTPHAQNLHLSRTSSGTNSHPSACTNSTTKVQRSPQTKSAIPPPIAGAKSSTSRVRGGSASSRGNSNPRAFSPQARVPALQARAQSPHRGSGSAPQSPHRDDKLGSSPSQHSRMTAESYAQAENISNRNMSDLTLVTTADVDTSSRGTQLLRNADADTSSRATQSYSPNGQQPPHSPEEVVTVHTSNSLNGTANSHTIRTAHNHTSSHHHATPHLITAQHHTSSNHRTAPHIVTHTHTSSNHRTTPHIITHALPSPSSHEAHSMSGFQPGNPHFQGNAPAFVPVTPSDPMFASPKVPPLDDAQQTTSAASSSRSTGMFNEISAPYSSSFARPMSTVTRDEQAAIDQAISAHGRNSTGATVMAPYGQMMPADHTQRVSTTAFNRTSQARAEDAHMIPGQDVHSHLRSDRFRMHANPPPVRVAVGTHMGVSSSAQDLAQRNAAPSQPNDVQGTRSYTDLRPAADRGGSWLQTKSTNLGKLAWPEGSMSPLRQMERSPIGLQKPGLRTTSPLRWPAPAPNSNQAKALLSPRLEVRDLRSSNVGLFSRVSAANPGRT